ncbi:hypothetical protein Tco_0980421 [Tanacetum coccineum]
MGSLTKDTKSFATLMSKSSLKSRSIQDEAFQMRQSFQDNEKYEHVSPDVTSSQEGERPQDDEDIMFD